MKAQARYRETVGDLLYRIFGHDSDELESLFYELNPDVDDHFLEPGQEVNIPLIDDETENDSDDEHVIEVWE